MSPVLPRHPVFYLVIRAKTIPCVLSAVVYGIQSITVVC